MSEEIYLSFTKQITERWTGTVPLEKLQAAIREHVPARADERLSELLDDLCIWHKETWAKIMDSVAEHMDLDDTNIADFEDFESDAADLECDECGELLTACTCEDEEEEDEEDEDEDEEDDGTGWTAVLD